MCQVDRTYASVYNARHTQPKGPLGMVRQGALQSSLANRERRRLSYAGARLSYSADCIQWYNDCQQFAGDYLDRPADFGS